MEPEKYDIIVVGLGVHGSACLYELAKRNTGKTILGLDQFPPGHKNGSSHGETRILRLSNAEGDAYIDSAKYSLEQYKTLTRLTGKELYKKTSAVMIGPQQATKTLHNASNFVENSLQLARRYGITHEHLSANAIKERYPFFNTQAHEFAYFENEAGFLRAEDCVVSFLSLAEGNTKRQYGKIVEIKNSSNSDSVIITTANEKQYEAKQVVLSAGPFLKSLIPACYHSLFKTTRQILYWFKVEPHAKAFFRECPIYIWDLNGDVFYGFPSLDGETVKVATEYDNEVEPSSYNKQVSAAEKQAMFARFQGRLLKVTDQCVHAETCLYTMTTNSRFIIDRLKEFQHRVLLVSACSGHGFKHAPAVANWVVDGLLKEEYQSGIIPAFAI